MFKSFLAANKIEPPKTHDLHLLCTMCIEIELDFDDIYEAAGMLTGYSVIPRYPAELGLVESDAEKAIEYAEEIITFINKKLETL
jgi:HEPN domain-containing protein